MHHLLLHMAPCPRTCCYRVQRYLALTDAHACTMWHAVHLHEVCQVIHAFSKYQRDTLKLKRETCTQVVQRAFSSGQRLTKQTGAALEQCLICSHVTERSHHPAQLSVQPSAYLQHPSPPNPECAPRLSRL